MLQILMKHNLYSKIKDTKRAKTNTYYVAALKYFKFLIEQWAKSIMLHGGVI